MRGIVITTSEFTQDFLRPLLDSIEDVKYPVLVVSNGGYNPNDYKLPPDYNRRVSKLDIDMVINDWNGWELGGIQRGKEKFEEFVHIMDTTLIKDISLFDKLFAIEGNVALTKDHFHYMGKYVSKLIPNTPRMNSKELAIFHETTWLDKSKNYSEFIPDLPVHTDVFETIHGKERMKLENDYMIKWKGTWQRSAEHP